MGEATRSLTRGGRLGDGRRHDGPEGRNQLRALFAKQLSLLGSYMGAKGESLRVAQLFFAGRLKPIIDRTFLLVQAG